MTRKEKITILQSIESGKLSIIQALTSIRINEEGYFSPLVGMDSAEYLQGITLNNIVLKDGVPGRIRFKSDVPEFEIYQ